VTEVTAEQARAAAEVLRALNAQERTGGDRIEHGVWAPGGLDAYADRLERERAAEAKREKRIDKLATDLALIMPEVRNLGFPAWRSIARHLTQLYPSLLDEKGNEQ